MAFTEFYVTSTGAATNGGSGTGAAKVTKTNCSWNGANPGTVTNDDANGWGTAAIGDWLVFDTAGSPKRHGYISAVSGDNLTVSFPAAGGVLSGKTCTVGGAWDLPSSAAYMINQWAGSSWKAGHADFNSKPPRVNILAGSYTDSFSLTTDWTYDCPCRFEGYTSSPGDGGEGEIVRNSGATTAIIYITGTYVFLKNLYVHTIQANIHALRLDGYYGTLENIRAFGTGTGAISYYILGYGTSLINCFSSDSAAEGFYLIGRYNYCAGCWADSAGTYAFRLGDLGTTLVTCIGSNSGDDCYYFESTNPILALINSIAYSSSTGSGIRVNILSSNYLPFILGNIFYGNNQYGIESDDAFWGIENYNALGSNTAGARLNVNNVGANDVTLSADPFVNSGTSDFRLNNTAGGGAACREAGFPGDLIAKTRSVNANAWGKIDIGALQFQAAAAAGMIVHPGMMGGLRG